MLRFETGLRALFRLARPAVSLGAILCLLASGPPARGQGTGQNTIHGKVSGPDGRPVEVEVKLKTITHTVVDSTYSNSTGEFTFQGVGDGNYYVSVESDLYQHAVVSTRVVWNINPWTSVDILLKALPPAERMPQNGVQSGSPLIDVKELSAKFPKNAVKEYERGNEQVKRGEIEAAIRSYRRALELAPSMVPALNNLGNAYLRTKRFPEAEAAFQRAVSANAGGAEAYINLGHLCYESQRYGEAEKFLRQGMKRYPGSALAYFFLGMTYARLGNAPAAEINLRKALALDEPAVAEAHLELANLCMRTNRLGDAREELEAFLKARPHDPQADRIRQTLIRLRDQSE